MVSAFLQHLSGLPFYKGQMIHVETIPPRMALYGSLEKPLHPALEKRLDALGMSRLYSHQAQAVNLVRRGHNVMVATPSASGKTLCYNLPALESLLTDKLSRALYLFPTKALAQDQLRSLSELASPELLAPGECVTFDGDTPSRERSQIKRKSRIVLTNPDMLHVGILPHHASWSRLLRNLRYVVVDEAHTYRGVFGSHVANVLRRLRRLCAAYGSSPQFICCSATIANPGEHAARLTGLPFEVVAGDGSPYGGKDFVFWNPPLVDAAKSARRSANSEATALFTELVKQGRRSLAFARSRKLTELTYIYSRDRLAQEAPGLVGRIMPYRAGYMPQERRRIERELFEGRLLGVVATNALELGVDIGTLEATILTGYPGSIASAWQQAGRSGRRAGERSLSFLIGLDNPLDQYFMNHPQAFFGKSFENALTNPENPYILKPHLLCAAWELPLTAADEALFGPAMADMRGALAAEGLLREREGRWYLTTAVAYPAQKLNIRSTSGEPYRLVDEGNGELLETLESSVAFFQVHPGAIYLHQGESYLVTRLDLSSHTAYARPVDAKYYTQTRELTEIRILKRLQEKEAGPVSVYLGEVEVATQVIGFRKKAQFSEEVIGEEFLDMPVQRFPTVAVWFDLPVEALRRIAEAGLDVAGGLHATEHAAIALLPLFALCDRNDLGGVSTPLHSDTGKPQIFIHDAHPGGMGIAEKGYELIGELWRATLEAVAGCPCEAGCPSCVQSPKCGNNNEPLDKDAAVMLLEGLLGRGSSPPPEGDQKR